MITENITFNGRKAKETRLIKSTSKRQITIPKSFFDTLALEDGATFVAEVYDNGVFLKPQFKSKENARDQDRERIIRHVFREGHSSQEELIEELSYRLKKYDEFIARRLQEFENDILNSANELDDAPGADSFNGLDVFFDKEAGTSSEET